jgi:acyl-coenzyme A synthetase/AMP-(fatty) acid ligase
MKNNEWIMEVFQAWGEKEFLIFNGQSYTYSDLVYKVESVREKLQESGLRPDDCVAVIGDYSPNVIFMLLALILNGNIIVPVAKETPAELIEIFSTARVSKVVKFDCQDRWDISIVNQSSSHPLLETLRNQHEAGVIIFTSGTSGKSKAAVLQVSRLIERYKNFKPKPFRTLIFLKLDHIGGINTLFSILFNGGALITATGRSPEPVCEAIQKYQVELLPTTPTFLNMLIMSQCYQNYDLSSLKLISY